MKTACVECVYWKATDSNIGKGECRISPPRKDGEFPVTFEAKWCGQFSGKGDRQARVAERDLQLMEMAWDAARGGSSDAPDFLDHSSFRDWINTEQPLKEEMPE